MDLQGIRVGVPLDADVIVGLRHLVGDLVEDRLPLGFDVGLAGIEEDAVLDLDHGPLGCLVNADVARARGAARFAGAERLETPLELVQLLEVLLALEARLRRVLARVLDLEAEAIQLGEEEAALVVGLRHVGAVLIALLLGVLPSLLLLVVFTAGHARGQCKDSKQEGDREGKLVFHVCALGCRPG